jgi:hypothetical protein
VIRYYDNPDAVFYLDPPYHPDTWDTSQGYDHVPDASHHEQLVELILQCIWSNPRAQEMLAAQRGLLPFEASGRARDGA